MPERQPDDSSELTAMRVGEHHLVIRLASAREGLEVQPEPQVMTVSFWNAARLLGCLSLFLGVRLHPNDAKRLIMGAPPP